MGTKIQNIVIVIIAGIIVFGIIFSAWMPGKAESDRAAFARAAPGDWGLGYFEDGSQPKGNSDKEYLRQFDAYYVGAEDEKVIYLTFDAGYENGYTESMLDVLKEEGVPAAFFLTGHYFTSSGDLVRRMVEDGHIVGNHTVNHPDMSKVSDSERFEREILGIEELYQEVVGKAMPKYYRPPSGRYSGESLRKVQEMGYASIFWSLAYADWDNDNQPTKETAFSRLSERMHPGAVVLLHATSRTNSEILGELIAMWKQMGYRFESLDHLVGQMEKGASAPEGAAG
ncbi:MAG: polysaccharide deacetylase family protein [Christensenellales bacterium]